MVEGRGDDGALQLFRLLDANETVIPATIDRK